jgi:hypothetical protein
MKSNLVKIEILILIGILVLSALALIPANTTATDSQPEPETSARGTRSYDIKNDLLLVTSWGAERPDNKFDDPYYLGDKDASITVYLENIYDNDPNWWDDSIEQCYVNITSTDPVFTVTDGTGSERSFDEGQMMSETYYFDIENTGTLGYGNKITIRAQYVTVDDLGEKTYVSGTMTLDLKLSSGIRSQAGSEQNFEAQALSELNNPMKLYAGATFQKIRVIIYTNVGEISNVEATISSLPADLEIESGTEKSMADTIYGSKAMYWRIDVAIDAEPGFYTTGGMRFKYTRTYGTSDTSDDVTINEPFISNIVTFAIDYTPLISPPEDNEFVANSIDLTQKDDTSKKVNVDFSNTGNVDLRNIEVTLDLDNAQFIRPLGFYYDESAWATQMGYGLTQTIDDLPVGDNEQISFTFFANPSLPPGKYLVPVTYEAYYYDDGSTGSSTGFVQTSNVEFETIETATQGSTRGPYIFIEVTDASIDITAKSTSTLVPGSRNIPIYVSLENGESYDFTGVKVYLEAGGTTPIRKPGDTTGTETKLEPEEIGSFIGGMSTTLNFIADVDPDAVGGLYDVNVYITGFDELKNEYTLDGDDKITKEVQLRVVSIPPSFVITSVETTAVKPGGTFTLSVTLRNSGGSDASDLKVLLNASSNLFLATNAVMGPYPLVKVDANQALTFEVKAGDIDYSEMYYVDILLSYKDPEGNEVRFNEGTSLGLTLQSEPEEEEEEFTIDFGLALIFSIMILLVAIIVAAVIIRGAIAKGRIGKSADLPSNEPSAPPLAEKRVKRGPPPREPPEQRAPPPPPQQQGPPPQYQGGQPQYQGGPPQQQQPTQEVYY